MNYNNLKRGRSPPQPPPFVYDDMMRPAPNHREYDNPYRLPPQTYDGPGRHYPGGPAHPMDMQPMHVNPHNHIRQALPPHPFIESQNHNNYAPSFNEHYYDRPSPANSYAAAPMGYRDPHPPHQPNPTYPNQPRSCSPPYKILCITNINQKIGDGPVKDALTSDFSRFGDISVSVCHDSGERLAYIYFRNCEDAREARQFKSRTIFFDRPIEIEPIYEPIRGGGSPAGLSPSSPMMPPSGLPVYSPRRRSMSPPNYQRDMNDPIASRGGPGPPQLPSGGDPPSSPLIYSQHRGPSPVDYCLGAPTRYSHGGRTPPPPMPPAHYERRSHHGAYNHYRSPHMTPPYSSSPTHEQYKSAYRSPSNQSPYSVASPNVLPRERAHIPSRSPHREPYHPAELRGPPASHSAHHHSLSRSISSSHHATHSLHARQPYSHSSHRSQPIGQRQYHHNYPPDPPARYMSRDFRRGKFGTDPHPHEHDDSRPSRVLLVNNIDATKTEKDLREAFEPFGTIEEMEIKNVALEISSALIKFSSMDGAYKAKTANNGRHLGNLRCRIVYGKVTSSKRLWIGGLSPSTTVSSMEDECSRYGDIVSMDYTSGRPYCYVEYETANQAQFAAHQLRTTLTPAPERKIRIEFVDPDRSEKLAPRHEPEAGSKSRTTNESAYDLDASPRSTSATSCQKRSVSPLNDLSISKRLCPAQTDMPPVAASTFKQERLAAAAAAAKARTSSTTSSSASHQTSDKSDKIRDVNDCSELNNNSDSNQLSNGNLSTSTQTPNLENDQPSHEAPSQDRLSQCSSIREIVQCCSVSWPGQIALRNFIFPAQIYMCSGKKQIIDRYLSKPGGSNGDSSSPLLRITQRWRLHPQPKLEEVKRRMQSGNLGMLVLTARFNSGVSRNSTTSNTSGQQSTNGPSPHQSTLNKTQQNGHLNKSAASVTPQTPGSLERTESDTTEGGQIDGSASAAAAAVNSDEVSLTDKGNSATVQDASVQDRTAAPVAGSQTQSRPLRNLISYLEQKDAAGVVSLSAVECSEQASSGSALDGSSKLLYAFPPGDFALNLLRRLATNLAPDSPKDEYLLGVIVGGNVEGGKV